MLLSPILEAYSSDGVYICAAYGVRAIMMVDEQSRSAVGMGVEVEDDDGQSVAFCHWY